MPTCKWISSHLDNAVWYVDSGKRFADFVFANRFISEIYFLNGRKVVTWIPQKTKNGEI